MVEKLTVSSEIEAIYTKDIAVATIDVLSGIKEIADRLDIYIINIEVVNYIDEGCKKIFVKWEWEWRMDR